MTSEFRIGRRLVQPELNTIVLAGRPTRVEPKVMEVLVYLVKRPGEVVQRETLIRDVWGETFVTDAALTRCIGELRRLFDDDVRNPRVIQTIAKSGYRLIAEVEPASNGPDEPGTEAAVELAQIEAAPVDQPRRRGPLLVLVLVGTVCLLAGGLGMFVAIRFMSRPGLPVLRATLPLGGQLIDLNDSAIAVSPDGSRIAYRAVRDGNPRIFLRALDGRDASPMPGTEEARGLFFSPDGRWVGFLAARKLKKASTENSSVVQICDVKGFFRGASWAPDGTILFVAGGDLYRVPGDGGVPELAARIPRAIDSPSGLGEPQILPSGRGILASRFRAPNDRRDVIAVSLPDGKWKVLVRDARWPRYVPTGHMVYKDDQSRLMAVTFDAVRLEVTGAPVVVAENVLWGHLGFGDKGTLLYAGGNPKRWRLAWVDRGGNSQPFGPADDYSMPALSPDGRRIAVGIEPDVYVYDLERNTLARVVSDAYFPIWTPDGKKLTYAAARKAGEHLNLWWRDAGGTGAEERLTTSPGRQTPDSWSPDGRLLSFWDGSAAGQALPFLLDLGNDRKLRCFTCPDRDGWGAMFSPDGRWLALWARSTATVDARPGEVWVHSVDGSSELQISNDGGDTPLWSPNGKELFFWQFRAYPRIMRMMAVDVVSGPPFRAGKPRVLFEGRYRVGRASPVSADGQKFLMVQPVENPITELQVVVNWFDELRARVRPSGK